MKTFYSTSRCFAILVCLSSLAISSVCPSSSSSPSFSSTTPTIAVNSIDKDSHEVSSSKHSSAEELPRGTIEESSNDSFKESSEDLSDDSSETTDHTVSVTTTNTNINTTNVDYTASSSEEVYRDLRTVQNLQRYIGLFQQWSLAFVSGPNLYLVRFEEPAKIEESGEFVHQVVTSNLTLKPLFNGILDASLPSEEMDDDGQRQLSMGETSPRSTLSPDAATSFKRMQYHRSTNTLIFLDRSGYLFTLNTANLATNRLHTSSSRVLDFSLNENTNVVYYATEDGGMVKVLRLFLQRDPNGSDHVWLDDSIVNTVLAVYVTRPESVRLHIDYGTNSLYLFIIINARVFTYEVKLFYDDTTETNTCDARCNRRFEVVRRISKFRVSRPLLNFNYYEYVKTRGLCEIVNFQTTRDRLIEIEFNCPNHSPHVERLNAGRMANWLKDLHKSNVTFDWLTYNYLYSTIMDTNRLLPGEEKYESLPVRIVIERSEKSNGRNIRHDLYMERVGFMSRSDLYVYNTTAYKNTQLRNRQTRKHIGIVDGISSYGFWRDVENVECMLVRTKELFRDIPELLSFSFRRPNSNQRNNDRDSESRDPTYDPTNDQRTRTSLYGTSDNHGYVSDLLATQNSFVPPSIVSSPNVRETINLWHMRNNKTSLRTMMNSTRPDFDILRAQQIIIQNQTKLINTLYLTIFMFLIILIFVCSIITFFHFKNFIARSNRSSIAV